ncbi:hypothetical protein ElyMa_005719600 [Elysia marginata]|uniref:Uncharacterized protein n=1 Tax=Elysia marginata TaxID=1093978 RepID=A0AAV4FJC9_9GAST|nr:hypothetical protein ElyMa_005719600 [Elysia marginata]
MRRNIIAGIYHGYSRDDLPQHQFCPPGPDSWCFFIKAIGEHLYPTGHKKRVLTPLDYGLLHEHRQPIYDRLASIELLKTEFNGGPIGLAMVKRSLGFQEGEHGQRLGQVRLRKRLYKSTQEQQLKAKRRKKIAAAAREKARQEKEAEEGGPAY